MRHAIAAGILLLTACASSDDASRFVVIESESHGCGAAEGLGCGLAIAPVLDAMDDLDGVAESSVSWDGRYFRVEVLPGADPDNVTTAATGLLEGEACCVTPSRGRALPAEPDRWFNAKQTVELSRHEAGVIAANYASAIAAEVPLQEDVAERLREVLREELERAFEQAHAAQGGVDRLWQQLPEAMPRFESRVAEFLTPEQREQVLAVVERELGQ